jgi:hypothetical protein
MTLTSKHNPRVSGLWFSGRSSPLRPFLHLFLGQSTSNAGQAFAIVVNDNLTNDLT